MIDFLAAYIVFESLYRMSFLSLIIAFLLEQLRPLPYRRLIAQPIRVVVDFVEARINAGAYRHGILAWMLLVLPAVLLTLALHIACYRFNPLLALAFNVLVLYLTMGFRQFSHNYSEIQRTLGEGNLEQARKLLSEWRGAPSDNLGSADISRLAIEKALIASHRHVFAVLLWFIILPGPCGALLYRLSALLSEYWQERPTEGNCEFVRFSRQVFAIIDWFPARATAAAFAIVGNFEDAIYCWRTQSNQWSDSGLGVVLASGAGALGIQLGIPVMEGDGLSDRVELGVGEPANVDFMQSAVGLVWRATVFWMLLLFLLELASW